MATTENRTGSSIPGITLLGGVIGAVAAIAVVILLAPLLLERVSANSFEDGTARVDTVFQFTGLDVALPELITMGDTTLFVGDWTLTPLFMFSLLAAIGFGIAGAITVGLVRWLPGTVDEAAVTGGHNRRLYANGIGVGAILGIFTAQFAATWLGSNTGIGLEIPIFRFLLALVGAGALLGASVVATTHLLARPDVVGVEGSTWETRPEFMGATRRALTIPFMAAAVIAVVVVVFGILLLASEDVGAAGPLVLASVVSIAILGGASYVAYKK